MNDNSNKIISVLKSAKRPAYFCHMRPDGDTLGAAFGLKKAFGGDVFCDSGVSSYYDIIPGIEGLNASEAEISSYDLLIAVDCADAPRLGKYAAAFLKHPNTVNIDHHYTNDSFAKFNYIQPAASSTGEIVFGLLKAAGMPLDRETAVCLYIAVNTDTGNFTHNNTTPESLLMAAELLKHGVDVSFLNSKLYKEMPENRLRLLSRTLDTLKLFENGRVAVLDITLKTFAELNCKGGDTEGFVEYAANCAGALVGILITEIARNSYKVSLRSKPGIDVSRVAAAYNGGGHKQAAGCLISGKLPDVIDKLVFACGRELA